MDLEKEAAEITFKKINTQLKKADVMRAKQVLNDFKFGYPDEIIYVMMDEYINMHCDLNSPQILVDWNYEKTKIQEKIDNFNKKEKLISLPKVTFSMFNYLKAKRDMTSEEQNRYANIICEMDKLVKIRDEVLNLHIALQNKYFEKKPKNPQNSIFYKIKKFFSKFKF